MVLVSYLTYQRIPEFLVSLSENGGYAYLPHDSPEARNERMEEKEGRKRMEDGYQVITIQKDRSSHVINNYQLDFKQLQREGVGCDQKKGQMFEVTEM